MMKRMAVCVCGLLAALILRPAGVSGADVPTEGASVPTTMPSGDAGTDLVVSFYKALLQEEPPTREQELALFEPVSALRWRLALGKGDPEDAQDGEPMNRTAEQRDRRRRQEEKVAAAGPVVLEYFRKHKDWFLPKNMRSIREIQVSSTYNFTRNLAYLKEPMLPGYGNVLVLFAHDKNAPRGQARLRSLVFRIRDGRINPDAIFLDGYQGKMTGELYGEEAGKQ